MERAGRLAGAARAALRLCGGRLRVLLRLPDLCPSRRPRDPPARWAQPWGRSAGKGWPFRKRRTGPVGGWAPPSIAVPDGNDLVPEPRPAGLRWKFCSPSCTDMFPASQAIGARTRRRATVVCLTVRRLPSRACGAPSLTLLFAASQPTRPAPRTGRRPRRRAASSAGASRLVAAPRRRRSRAHATQRNRSLAKNPFSTANMIYIRYCSSDAWMVRNAPAARRGGVDTRRLGSVILMPSDACSQLQGNAAAFEEQFRVRSQTPLAACSVLRRSSPLPYRRAHPLCTLYSTT